MEKGFLEIVQLIKQSQLGALRAVNTELINLYWNIGAYIAPRLGNAQWGENAIDELALFIRRRYPELKGFSRAGLYRMVQFYESYSACEFVAPLVRQIAHGQSFARQDISSTLLTQLTWTNHLIIFSRCKTPSEREFYIRRAIADRYSKRELDRQISSGLFERSTATTVQSSPTVPGEITSAFRDRYIFEFLNLPEPFDEGQLQQNLIAQMKSFILELGRDFLFVDQEYRLQVGNSDFYIDLLFYHRGLQALVAFEIKADKFRPQHLGQLNFYLEALDRNVKKPHENPSIGVLLCNDRDREVVEYALSRSLSPTMVAEYQMQLPDKKLLREKLHELLSQNDNS